MLWIVTSMLAVYGVLKGIDIVQIALISSRPDCTIGIMIGTICAILSVVAALFFVRMQEHQASSMGGRFSSP